MARKIAVDDDGTMYRAVIVKKYRRNAEPVTTYEGPYDKPGAARARVTFWKNWLGADKSQEQWADGWIESAETVWSRVDS